MRRRVVITGMGVVTPLGVTVDDLFTSQVEGRTAVGPITRFDARTFPTTFASEIKGFDLGRFLRDADRFEFCGLNTHFGLAAAKVAIEDAGLLDAAKGDRSRMGVYLGSGEGSDEFPALVRGLAHASPKGGPGAVDPGEFTRVMLQWMDGPREGEQEMHTPAGHIAETFALDGPNQACQTACAASSQAIGEAMDIIRWGDADVMVAGGSHSMIHPLGVSGFNRLTALSQRNDSPRTASRPFDLNRDGFVIGEGAGLIVLEELEHAKKRGAHIYAELTGYGTTADAYRMTDPHPEGRGAIRAIAEALADAGIKPADVGYINAHGTSTQANDSTETAAIKGVFGDHAKRVPISSTKSMLGHLIAAAGVVELVISVVAMRKGVVPPTINYETPDPACDLDYVPNAAREVRFRHVLSNSFGFGGQNIALIASKFTD
ncbi:3-oxoacyl-acp synthase : 3-oxoacyl-[acyl-carrier-protein] synthase 2 OS=Planctomyces limnophilus (strain ATCC 43296 / DSM 3776 / IFAM 1008 / 290) GN=Plim_3120 PE=3 SV=1: ketoacyl-synt: Ketoacyl-synt_C [Gemmataceae bacterium]|nr:3-oxoacyl-acp synthase : 3-oxoacyl-[acyl-carrier-protein] synthase 2 OS=Planctomyces limnophilus (strain ATCC 43296 / DSM 3776 / IFAM 1008 / 290) GN=Plim_3120 PE=3 SV=1: ketoacyl-synt: Ketoacyl-synt_C [Gemmataceae bacterium]VTU00560.1 3-oxoacyl-acp synthase : 3-oxoacyl-[acyl-carrier-protein] synthase 2 OS=Planctomyces limnophilus (strain ATCC 43296 / DSM 3776 / IFAM 1008 / 290) GN=Plim_3120 PE=3 SV=1: ketoacyl-synt: Ketoacyl-synt_C [Gemmataceae bacterium]